MMPIDEGRVVVADEQDRAALANYVATGNAWKINQHIEQTVYPGKDGLALAKVLEHMGVMARFNLRRKAAEIRFTLDVAGIPPRSYEAWHHADGRLTAWLREAIRQRYAYETDRGPKPLHYGSEAWMQAFNALLAENEVDPFLEWLQYGLPAWDGKLRIAWVLSEHFGVERSALMQWASAFLFLGPVYRAFRPGGKLDVMPVLVGPQGIGKSSLLREILPDERKDEWHADGLHLAAPDKDRAEALQGRVIVEASEMAGASRADLESLKAFLTRVDDGTVRLAFRPDPEPSPRRCIIVGTSNDAECLPNDATGLRRFVPVAMRNGCNVEAVMREQRLQLWAEALAWYQQGIGSAPLPRDLIPQAAELAEGARRRDETLENKIAGLHRPMQGTGWPLDVIARECGLVDEGKVLDIRQSRRLGAALRAAGWTPGREAGKRLWYFDADAL